MTNTNNNLEYKNPKIEHDINDALQRNINAGLGKTGLDGVLSQEVANIKANGGIEALDEFKEARAKSREKYADGNLISRLIWELKESNIPLGLSDEEQREFISKIIDCRPDQISLTLEEALSGRDIIYHYGDLESDDIVSSKGLILPLAVSSSVYLPSMESADNLFFPLHIGGYVSLNKLKSAKNTTFPRVVGADFDLKQLNVAENMVLPEFVGGNIYLNALTSAKNVTLPRIVGSNLYMDELIFAKNLVFPEEVTSIYLNSIMPAKYAFLSEFLGKNLNPKGITPIEGLDFSNINKVKHIHIQQKTYDKCKYELEEKYPKLVGKFSI